MANKFLLISIFLLGLLGCSNTPAKTQNPIHTEKEIIERYLKKGAWNHHFLTKEWEEWINKGLEADSTIAYLWQQKAIPYWKQKKYALAISFYDKAVELDRQQCLSRLGFLKCIFAKDYGGALADLSAYQQAFGSAYEQDHSLGFYKGLCYLQLNQKEKALKELKETIRKEETKHGVKWVHYLDRFYLAIAYYELSKYEQAIAEFDKVLQEYPQFSDAQYYKSICWKYLGELEMAKSLMVEGRSNFSKGYTINEDSSRYEEYPYQITWQWEFTESILK